jgi:predicted transcriptional regulator
MELDSFLSNPRWDILRIIIEKPSSPTEIAEKVDTTISFVSQQLKLLEATGLVQKQRTRESEKGKPRAIYSISKESIYLIPLAKGLGEKQLIPLSLEQKITVKIWNLIEKKYQNSVEKFFWSIQKYLDRISGIICYTKKQKLKVYVLSEDSSLAHEINEAHVSLDEELDFQVTTSSSLSNLDSEHLVPVYDSEGILSAHEVLKGGNE